MCVVGSTWQQRQASPRENCTQWLQHACAMPWQRLRMLRDAVCATRHGLCASSAWFCERQRVYLAIVLSGHRVIIIIIEVPKPLLVEHGHHMCWSAKSSKGMLRVLRVAPAPQWLSRQHARRLSIVAFG